MIKKKAPILEKDILNDVCQWLSENAFFFWRSNNIPVFGRNNGGKMTFRSMPKHSLKGVPDIIIIREGMFIGIEVKGPKGKMRPDQFIFKARCEAQGGKYYTVYCLDDLKKVMEPFVI